jgi:hypothetical protein
MPRINPATTNANKTILAPGEAADSEDSVCQIFAVTPQAIGTIPRKPKITNDRPACFLNAVPYLEIDQQPSSVFWSEHSFKKGRNTNLCP